MYVPMSWLKEYVDIDMPMDELDRRITIAGLEIVGVEEVGGWWDPEKIVVGVVIEVRPHPNADRLTIAVVDHGAADPQAVVTGAPNLHVGDSGVKVAFAREGAKLIDAYASELKYAVLKPTKIRGVTSAGMVCSEKELGISEEHTGIMLLPDDAPVGTPLVEYMGDTVIELDMTNDMAYASNIVGVAREIAALTGAAFKPPDASVTATGPSIADQVTVEIADPDLCKRYSASLIKGVTIGHSPFWMQQRLLKCGMRPINVIVDITNYVMLELGQPLHAFDYRLLRPKSAGGQPAIIVRRATPGEVMTTLDGVVRELTDDMLLITDGGGPVAIAGVMGGLESEVTEDTADILLESANFYNISIRKTSQALKLSSEAASRFGRGVDPELTTAALRRASELMRTLAGGTVASGVADAYPAPPTPLTIDFAPGEVPRLAGIDVETTEIMDMLDRLGFECALKDRPAKTISVTVPSHRLLDVSGPADLVEEVARMYGYERIPATLLEDELPTQRANTELAREERMRDVLVGCGLDEIISYSMTNLESVAKLTPGRQTPDPENYIRVANPLTPEREYMRQTLANSMLETVWANLRYTDRVALFEIAHVYLPVPGEELPDEPRRLCIAMTGPRTASYWQESTAGNFDFFDLKGIVEALLARLNVTGATYAPAEHPTFTPGKTASVAVGDLELGLFGELHPAVREAFDLPPQPLCLLELDVEALDSLGGAIPMMRPISRYPAVRQDLAIVVNASVPAAAVEQTIREAGGNLLVDVALFDVYRGEQIPSGMVSLAYSLTFQSREGTLTDRQVASVQGRIVKRLAKEHSATLRE